MTLKKNVQSVPGEATKTPAKKFSRLPKGKFAGLEKIALRNKGDKNPITSRGGLRVNPDFRALTFYVRRDTHHRVFTLLHGMDDGTNFSILMQQLLEAWLVGK